MRRSWSLTLKLLAVALLLLTRHAPAWPLTLAALGAVLAAVVLDLLDWRRERKFPWPRLLSGAVLLVAVAYFVVNQVLAPALNLSFDLRRRRRARAAERGQGIGRAQHFVYP